MSGANAVNLAKLPPFHEVVQRMLNPMRLIGIQSDALKQGEALGLLSLIMEAEIPGQALPDVIKTCTDVRACIEASKAAAKGIDLTVLEELLKIADAVIENLNRRLEAKAAAADAGGSAR